MLAVVLAATAPATALSVYPAHGQVDANQAHDLAECSAIATQQTGFDPRQPPPTAQASAQVAGSGARARGAAMGAMVGGVSGGNAGQGAAAGAVAGAVVQRSRNRQAARQQNAAIAQQQQYGQGAWDQARTACMTSRGYRVQ
jgi:hypothetical protein